MIVIVDYGMGNLGSVYKAFKKVTSDVKVSESKKDLEKADKLVLPGVGHFSNGVQKLESFDYIDVLNHKVLEQKKPVLGICLGMQLFAKFSYEGNVEGLNWLDAEVVKFDIDKSLRWKVPHMGWNSINIAKDSLLLNEMTQSELFYFVHSYYMKCFDEKDILGLTKYYHEFTSMVQKENIIGTQFHPEKSHDRGLKLIRNFVEKIG